jgi:riboflavin kinase/FMN adenylyltransferase
MEYIAGNKNFEFKNSAITLGKFDGLHLGHRQLVDEVVSYKIQGLTSIVFSFLLHPSNIFSEKEFELIYTEEEKRVILKRMGIDALISYPFTEETRSMEPEDFIRYILVKQLDTKIIVVGNDFRFGADRRGDVNLLKKYEEVYGYQVIAFEKMKMNNQIISSSIIRNSIKEGRMDKVNAMLGHPYFIRGEVVHGRKLGRTIGMPTTNLIPPSNKLLPPCGVYASKTRLDGILYPGVTNIGTKPTVGEEDFIGVETYIIDYNNDLYGKMIEVELHDYIRPEMKFGALEELMQQMAEDVALTKDYFKKNI